MLLLRKIYITYTSNMWTNSVQKQNTSFKEHTWRLVCYNNIWSTSMNGIFRKQNKRLCL